MGERYLSQSSCGLIGNIHIDGEKKFSWRYRASGLGMAPVL